jgi:tetrahydromethanopterin S-methyltransferase subunit G
VGGPRGSGGQDEEGYRQKVNERFDRLAERVERLEEEVRQLRGGGAGGGSQSA